jgi:hypothetical protein
MESMERCQYCGDDLSTAFNLRRHIQRKHSGQAWQAQAQPGRVDIARREPELRRTEIESRGPFPALTMAPGEAIRRSAEPTPERARLWLQYGWLKAMQVKIEKGLASEAECEQYMRGEAEYLSAISGRKVAPKITNGNGSVSDSPMMQEAQAQAIAQQAEDRSLWFFLPG